MEKGNCAGAQSDTVKEEEDPELNVVLIKELEATEEEQFTLDGWESVLNDTKAVMKELYKQYTGNPYHVEHIKAQEAIVRAVRHDCRWQRGVTLATNVSELGLMEAQMRHILGIKVDAKYKRTLKSELSSLKKETNAS